MSSNSAIPLPDGTTIQLTRIEADRIGKQYGEKVDPDEIIPAPAPGSAAASRPVNPANDATIEAAKTWLKRSCER